MKKYLTFFICLFLLFTIYTSVFGESLLGKDFIDDINTLKKNGSNALISPNGIEKIGKSWNKTEKTSARGDAIIIKEKKYIYNNTEIYSIVVS